MAEYLEVKRLAFPRFYFISSADLLDILSNGTNPQLVSLVLQPLCHCCHVEDAVLGFFCSLSALCAPSLGLVTALSHLPSFVISEGQHLRCLLPELTLLVFADGPAGAAQSRERFWMP